MRSWLGPVTAVAWGLVVAVARAQAGPAQPSPGDPGAVGVPALQPYHDPVRDRALQFAKCRLAADPDDSRAANLLARECLDQLRLSGDLAWLTRASAAVDQSLRAVPASVNREGLALSALVRYESHDFAGAVRLAQEVCAARPEDPKGFALLGDARLEAGDYAGAEAAYREMQRLTSRRGGGAPPENDVRVAHLAWLRGDADAARAGLGRALAAASRLSPPSPETVAFCHVQLGQLDFGVGDWPAAEAHYRAALAEQPFHFSAYEHLAELAGARGDYDGAVRLLQELVARVPRPEFFQELADLHLFMGKPLEAKPWQDQAEAAYLASAARGEKLYLHHLASFYADTRESPAEALRWARLDLESCQGVFAHEGLGWALYRAGDLAGAAAAFDRAVALGTPSAHLLFQAGTVYFRAGQVARGREFIQRARAVNPRFESFHVHR